MTGYALTEVIGRNCRFLQNGESAQAALAAVRNAIATQTEVQVVLRNYRKDGSLFWNDLYLFPLPDETGKITRFIGVLTDISEQKRDQEQRGIVTADDEPAAAPNRTLLLVDDEQNILSALKRLLRRDGYQILTANSAQEGLEVLAKNKVDVILSDQRMPGMNGVEFLRTAKITYPDTVRIVLSGYTELQSVTDAINEGAVYRFLTKPWEDQLLRDHIEEAFQHKEMADENRRLNLQVRTANQSLATANRQLEELLQQQRQQIMRDEASLDIVREALQHVPLPVIGLDDDNMVAFANDAAQNLFEGAGPILGSDATQLIPELLHATQDTGEDERCIVKLNGALFQVVTRSMGQGSQSRGKLMTLTQYLQSGMTS